MVWSTEAVPANTPGHCGDLEFLIVRILRSQASGGSGEHSVWRDVMCTSRTPEPRQNMQIRLCLPIQLSIPRPCQGFLSLTSGFLCSPAFWWLHPACVTQAFKNHANPIKWCHALASRIQCPVVSGYAAAVSLHTDGPGPPVSKAPSSWVV